MGKLVKIRAAVEIIVTLLWGELCPHQDIMDGKEHMLRSGAKIYYRGSGWWMISGYAADGRDVDDMVYAVRHARRIGSIKTQLGCNEWGWEDTYCRKAVGGCREFQKSGHVAGYFCVGCKHSFAVLTDWDGNEL